MAQTKFKPRPALAWLLTLCMVFGMLPMTAFAEDMDSSVITAFEPLDELTTTQYWELGTDKSEPILPDMLTATVTVTSGAAIAVTTTEDIAVSDWQSEPAYDPDTLGTYVFAPTLDLQDGYRVADGVDLPKITVEVKILMGIDLTAISSDITLTDGQNLVADTIGTSGGNITITVPTGITVNVSGTQTISGTVTFQGGGKLVRAAEFASGNMFNIPSDATLNLGANNTSGVIIDGASIQVKVNGAAMKLDGALNVYDGTVIENHYVDGNFTGNDGGGAIFASSTSDIHIYNGIFRDNKFMNQTAGGRGGGAIKTDGGIITMDNGLFTGNETSGNGGALYIIGNATLNLNGGQIVGNKAGRWGGAIEASAYALNLFGGKINSNVSALGGGGIDADSTTMKLKIKGNAEVTGNLKGTTPDNVYIYNSTTFKMVGNFTGSIGIANSGTIFGATESMSYTGVENFFKDGTSSIGIFNGSNLAWTTGTKITGVTIANSTGDQYTTALTPSNGAATYQWYYNSVNSTTGGTIVVGATGSTFKLSNFPSYNLVDKYLYVVISGTNGYTGTQTSNTIVVVPGGDADTVINIADISGVAAPVAGATPVTTITETTQYTGTVTWSPAHSTFINNTAYTATITLIPKSSFTLTGVAANFFTVDGATTVTNNADSGAVTAVFPATGVTAVTVTSVIIKTAPIRTNYSTGENLDLTGLVVTLNKSNSTTEDVAFAKFASKNITTSPANGTKLTTANTSVTINYTTDNKTVNQAITVNSTAGVPIITTINLPEGTVLTAYSQTLAATGTAPITWSVESGLLPAGLTLSGNTISGTPTTAESRTFTVKAENSAGNDAKSLSITVTASQSYTVAVNGSYAGTTGAGSYTQGTTVNIYAGSRSDYSFNGWTVNSGGITLANTNNAMTTFTMPANAVAVTANWSYNGGSLGGGDNGNDLSDGDSTPTPKQDPTPAPTANPTSAPTTPPDNSSNVLVDGKEVSAGTVEAKGDTVTVTVNQETIQKQLGTAKDNVTIVIPVDEQTGTAVAQLVVKNVDDMASKEMTLTVQVGNVQYELPTTAIDTAAVLAALGASNAADVPISITVTTNVSETVQAAVNNAIEASGCELVIPPMEFRITATYEGKTVEIDTFSQYVSRSAEITEEQAQRVTTAIIVDLDGTTRHVPTRVYQKDGKWYTEVNSLTNSIYALVYNEKTFADAKGKWYEAAVNEMASRMVISGVGDDSFAGERDITRAEFAAIIVKALGLPTNRNGAVFTDVSRSAWYCGAVGTAYEYGIISGVGDNKYDPNRAITRQEAMIMVQRAAKIAGFKGNTGNLSSFTDAGNVSSWALEAAMWSIGSGLVSGYDGRLNPLNNITRAETATLVLSLLQKSGLVDMRNNKPLAKTAVNSETTFAVMRGKENDPIQLLGYDGDDIMLNTTKCYD